MEHFFSGDLFDHFYTNARQNCVLLMSASGIILAANPAFLNCFEYSAEELQGNYFGMLFTAEDRETGLPEREITNVLNYGSSSDNNYLVSGKKAKTWVSGESIRVKDSVGEFAIMKVIQNIHQQKISEHEIIRLNDLNEDILRNVEDAVIVIDDGMNVIKGNTSFFDLFKKQASDIPGLNLADLIKAFSVRDGFSEKIQNAIQTREGFFLEEVEIHAANGDKRVFEMHCLPMTDSAAQNVLLVLHDITLKRQLEREREDIIGLVAHELRNPLSNVLLTTAVISMTVKDKQIDELKDLLERSTSNVKRMQRIISELYDATKAGKGHLNMEMADFDFNKMVREAIDTVQVLHPATQIILRSNGNARILADRHRLIQVITNYLTNGIKYSTDQDSVILTVAYHEDRVEVSVEDHGVGISPRQLPFVFDKFFRAEATRNIEGVGLGLYLSRQIILAHLGEVWAESEEGKGSVFYFSIPIKNS